MMMGFAAHAISKAQCAVAAGIFHILFPRAPIHMIWGYAGFVAVAAAMTALVARCWLGAARFLKDENMSADCHAIYSEAPIPIGRFAVRKRQTLIPRIGDGNSFNPFSDIARWSPSAKRISPFAQFFIMGRAVPAAEVFLAARRDGA